MVADIARIWRLCIRQIIVRCAVSLLTFCVLDLLGIFVTKIILKLLFIGWNRTCVRFDISDQFSGVLFLSFYILGIGLPKHVADFLNSKIVCLTAKTCIFYSDLRRCKNIYLIVGIRIALRTRNSGFLVSRHTYLHLTILKICFSELE
jgi:hypothetical protein